MQNLKNISIAFIVICVSFGTMAQDYHEEINKITELVQGAESAHIVSEIIVYTDESKKREVLKFDSEIRKSGEQYRSKIAETEVISNDKYTIVVDHDEKVVNVQKREKMSKKDEEFLNNLNAVDIDEEKIDSIIFLGANGSLRTYDLLLPWGEIAKIKVVLNVEKHTIHSIAFSYNKRYYPENNYVVVNYSEFNYNAGFKKEIFQAKDILSKKAGSFHLNSAYSSYKLDNLIPD